MTAAPTGRTLSRPSIITPRPPGLASLPLSSAQERLWLMNQIDPADTAYHMYLSWRIRGPLDAGLLADALSGLVGRHEILRTRFPATDGIPAQVIDPPTPVRLERADLERAGVAPSDRSGREDDQAELERAARDLLVERIEAPFDLARGPMLRATLIRLAAEDHVLGLIIHHIVADGWSLGLLCAELSTRYRSARRQCDQALPALPPLPIQYGDYALWQRGPDLATFGPQMRYWIRQLAAAPPLDLRGSRPRPPVRSSRAATLRRPLPADLCAGVTGVARSHRATVFMAVLAAYQAVLARHSGLDDICVGTPASMRGEEELEPLIGLFVNTLVLRGDLSGDPSFAELITRIRGTALDAYARADLPFDRIVNRLGVPRDLSRTVVFQAMFQLEPLGAVTLALEGAEVAPLDVGHRSAQVDLSLEVAWDTGGARAEFVYSTDLFDATVIGNLADDLVRVLEVACASPNMPLSGC